MTNITCSNSITTVQQDSNLQKTYFNISGKFYTKNTTFYIFLDNDVYEIPLDKLQVNGSSQATMQDGINALSAILVNAGTSGGGGGGLTSVAVDGTTIAGNGTLGNPLYSTTALPVINMEVDLSADDYYMSGAGIYGIVNFGQIFYFNDVGIVDGSRVILTNRTLYNLGIAYINGAGGVGVKYQGTNKVVDKIPSGTSYEFIYYQSDAIWYCLNPNPQYYYTQDIGGLINPFDIDIVGYFRFLNTGGGAGINLPNGTFLVGQEITIWNGDTTEPIVINSNQPVNLDYSSVTQIPPQTCMTIVGIEAFGWYVKNIFTV